MGVVEEDGPTVATIFVRRLFSSSRSTAIGMGVSFAILLRTRDYITMVEATMQQKPQISASPTRVKSGENVMLSGTGFTPNRSAMSHLRRPNETEYNPIRLRVNDRGEISHKIDTVMLDEGAFEVWVEDETSKSTSNRVRFNVESSFTRS
jgi:hypothetical protein